MRNPLRNESDAFGFLLVPLYEVMCRITGIGGRTNAEAATISATQEVSERLVVSVETVKTHVSNILSKLNLADRTQLAIYALKNGLAESDWARPGDSLCWNTRLPALRLSGPAALP